MKLIRDRIDAEVERAESDAQDNNDGNMDGNNNNDKDILTSFKGHVKLGSPRPLRTIEEIVNDHASQPEFQGFHQKFTNFINQCLPVYLELDPNSWNNISFLETHQVCSP